MRVFRARLASVTILVAAGLVLSLRAQTMKQQRLEVVNVGLPAVDLGLLTDEIRGPAGQDSLRRQALIASVQQATGDAVASRSAANRVIVKFIEGLPTVA